MSRKKTDNCIISFEAKQLDNTGKYPPIPASQAPNDPQLLIGYVYLPKEEPLSYPLQSDYYYTVMKEEFPTGFNIKALPKEQPLSYPLQGDYYYKVMKEEFPKASFNIKEWRAFCQGLAQLQASKSAAQYNLKESLQNLGKTKIVHRLSAIKLVRALAQLGKDLSSIKANISQETDDCIFINGLCKPNSISTETNILICKGKTPSGNLEWGKISKKQQENAPKWKNILDWYWQDEQAYARKQYTDMLKVLGQSCEKGFVCLVKNEVANLEIFPPVVEI